MKRRIIILLDSAKLSETEWQYFDSKDTVLCIQELEPHLHIVRDSYEESPATRKFVGESHGMWESLSDGDS